MSVQKMMLVPVGKYKSLQEEPPADAKEVSFTAPPVPVAVAPQAEQQPRPAPSVQVPIKPAVPVQEPVTQPSRPLHKTPTAQPLPKGIRDLLSRASTRKKKPKRLNWLTL